MWEPWTSRHHCPEVMHQHITARYALHQSVQHSCWPLISHFFSPNSHSSLSDTKLTSKATSYCTTLRMTGHYEALFQHYYATLHSNLFLCWPHLVRKRYSSSVILYTIRPWTWKRRTYVGSFALKLAPHSCFYLLGFCTSQHYGTILYCTQYVIQWGPKQCFITMY